MKDENAEITIAILLELPRLMKEYGHVKTGEILDCITDILATLPGREKDVVTEAFATIVKIGHDANEKDKP